VVFNPFSGQTHYLDIVTGRVLLRIIARSSNTTELRSEISDFLEVGNDDQVAEMVEKILIRLADEGLVEPVD
jgi:PqqD family protein of HPr-rel-A system